jgi:hypothetical protein
MRRRLALLGAVLALLSQTPAATAAAPQPRLTLAAQAQTPGAPFIGSPYQPPVYVPGSGSGPPAYQPSAVHLDGGVSFITTNGAALTSTGTMVAGGDTGAVANTSHFTASWWVKGVTISAATGSTKAFNTSAFGDIMSPTEQSGDSSENSAIDFVWDSGGGFFGTFAST